MRVLGVEESRDVDLAGLSVGVLLPADEATRVVPALVGRARSVKVFQEEPVWVAPVDVPVVGPLAALARLHLRLSVKDPWTRRLLTPGPFGRRDVLVCPSYYRALQAPHCTLVTWPVYAVVEHGVRTAEGIEHRVDVLIAPHHVRKALAA